MLAKQPPTEQEPEISYLPYDWVEQSMRGYDINPLYRYFTKVAGKEEAGQVVPCLQSRHVKDVERFDRVLADRCQG